MSVYITLNMKRPRLGPNNIQKDNQIIMHTIIIYFRAKSVFLLHGLSWQVAYSNGLIMRVMKLSFLLLDYVQNTVEMDIQLHAAYLWTIKLTDIYVIPPAGLTTLTYIYPSIARARVERGFIRLGWEVMTQRGMLTWVGMSEIHQD